MYLKVLAGFYLIGALFHLADLFDWRLEFSTMSSGWQLWIVYLLVFDTIASVGLWKSQEWGVAIFLLVALSQLIAYVGFPKFFGDQQFLIVFHIVTVGIYLLLRGFSLRFPFNRAS